ncbi:MAG: hypothetical protein K6F88_02815 [Ruminococcus sp.]|nr:hypothetical protein [Ruminococcus sp.]
MFFKKEEVTSFGWLRLRLSGMRGAEEYEVRRSGDTCDVVRYQILYKNGEERREPEQNASCPAEQMTALLSDCGVLKWDGFKGPNPRGVRDGWMFRFEAEINGRRIRAEGSNNYPRHYREFREGLSDILN